MDYTLRVEGMHCDSCSRVISRIVSKNDGASVKNLDATTNEIILSCTQEQLPRIQSQLKDQGYQLLLPGEKPVEGFEAGSLKRGVSFISNVLKNAPEYKIEHSLFLYSFSSFIAILAVQAILYFTFFQGIPNFISSYWSVLLLSAISIPMILNAVFHARAFRRNASCMVGMMVGMTFGMASGFLFGAFAGATNGMFVGSLIGMAIGMFLGYQMGKCCGVMGIMEGLMGGLMAGTMGAMLSVMMVYDHQIPFLFILTLLEGKIMLAFSYFLYKEYGPIERKPVSAVSFVAIAIACSVVLTLLYVFAPKFGIVLGA